VVRTIIVPAAMELLGDWNWYLPRWLEWLPNVSVEGRGTGAVEGFIGTAAGAEAGAPQPGAPGHSERGWAAPPTPAAGANDA